jgi:hypothetical protein
VNWFQQNRFVGALLIAFAVATLAAAVFLWKARSGFEEARAQFDQSAAELNRLQRLTPFPTDANLKKMRTQAEDYGTELNKLKEELKGRMLPIVPMAPNEFQARLRQAVVSLGEKARANRVKLPEPFFLGFEEFASALPDTAAAPGLGQQLAQAELLLNLLIDARVEAVTSFRRVPAAELAAAVATPTPAAGPRRAPAAQQAAGPQLVERTTVEAAFLSSPGSARRVLNQIATAHQQFYVVRTLHVLNEKDKGPTREGTAATTTATPPPANPAALNFIVGNERIQTSARIEMLRFTF